MHYIPSEKVVMFDVDDTLVMWDDDGSYSKNQYRKRDDLVEFKDPYFDGLGKRKSIYLKPNDKVIELLRKMKTEEDRTIVVWSAGGAPWANEVVVRLGLRDFVDLVISKPTIYVDDLPCQEFMLQRIIPENLND